MNFISCNNGVDRELQTTCGRRQKLHKRTSRRLSRAALCQARIDKRVSERVRSHRADWLFSLLFIQNNGTGIYTSLEEFLMQTQSCGEKYKSAPRRLRGWDGTWKTSRAGKFRTCYFANFYKPEPQKKKTNAHEFSSREVPDTFYTADCGIFSSRVSSASVSHFLTRMKLKKKF